MDYSLADFLFFLNSTAPYWFPILLGYTAWLLWIDYKRREWVSNIKWTLYEIRLPQEIEKSPLAMEVALTALLEDGQGKWIDKYYKGRVMLWSSLELVSLGGSVRFYMRLPDDVKRGAVAKIYSQYPGIEIQEAPDYTQEVDYDDGSWKLFGCEYKLSKPDPYPIMTYTDYGQGDLAIEKENQIDPLAPLVEFLGSMKRQEQLWLQILVQPTKKRFRKSSVLFGKQDWKKEAEKTVKDLKGEDQFNALSAGVQNTIKAIERSAGKHGFDCGIRSIYLGKKDSFDPLNISAMIGSFKQFSSQDLNGFQPQDPTKFNYPWEDYKDIRLETKKREMIDAYKRRSYFYPPYAKKPFVLNTEELATIYHFPAKVTDTPGFVRIESQKSEPPANLPV